MLSKSSEKQLEDATTCQEALDVWSRIGHSTDPLAQDAFKKALGLAKNRDDIEVIWDTCLTALDADLEFRDLYRQVFDRADKIFAGTA